MLIRGGTFEPLDRKGLFTNISTFRSIEHYFTIVGKGLEKTILVIVICVVIGVIFGMHYVWDRPRITSCKNREESGLSQVSCNPDLLCKDRIFINHVGRLHAESTTNTDRVFVISPAV